MKRAACHLAIASLINGCASAPVTFDERARTALDEVRIGEVTVASEGWGITDDVLSEASVAAAAGGGALGAVGSMPNFGACEGIVCGAAALVWLAVAGTVAMVGAARSGSAEAARNEARRAAQPMFESIKDVVNRLDAARGLRDAVLDGLNRNLFRVEARGPGETIARRDGGASDPPRLSLELAGVRLDEVRADGEPMPLFSLGLLLHYTLVDAESGTVMFEAYRQARRGPLPFERWARDGAAEFTNGLNALYAELAEAIIDELFLVYRSEDAVAPATEFGRGYFLAPEYPPRIGRAFPIKRHDVGFGTAGTAVIRTRQPVLRWSAIPSRAAKYDNDWPGDKIAAEDISYDLRVYDGSALIISADRLSVPRYQVPVALAPCKGYFWTFRARFGLDGKERVTDWAGSYNGFEPWNSRYPLLGIHDRDEYSNSDFADRTGYYHRFHVGNAAGKACGY